MRFILPLTLLLAIFTSPAIAAGKCGKVTIAEMTWNSAALIANIDKFILTHGYGCKAELVPGNTMPTGTSMVEKGEPDIAPELWTNSNRAAIDKGIAEKRLRQTGAPLSQGGVEGFWVPKYMVDKDPSLATIKGVIAKAKLFKHPEDPSRSGFMGCPAGWNCQITSGNLFKALKLKDAGFDLIDPGSGAALAASIAKAYDRKKPWFGYYWGPTAVLGKYKMVRVDFESGTDEKHYIDCISKAECEKPKVTMYPVSPVHTVTTEPFAARAPEAFKYLSKRGFKHDDVNEILAWMDNNQADGDAAMEHVLKKYEKVWTAWVPKDVAEKVKKALAKL